MTFLHLSLIAGLAAIAVPIALHLFGQRQPELLDFPALRFVRETRQEQSSSWQLRHFLLLLLRILLLAALVFALARPRVHSTAIDSVVILSAIGVCALLATVVAAVTIVGRRSLLTRAICVAIALLLWGIAIYWGSRAFSSSPPVPTSDNGPIAVALIVDNGPTMNYQFNNETRLEAAKSQVSWLLDEMPVDSKVGILSGVPMSSLSLDPTTAQSQLKLLEPRGAHVDLLSRLRTAVDLVLANDLERKEVYLVTDLTQASWSAAQPGLKEILTEHQDDVLIQIIDVGVNDQANWSLGDVSPSQDSVAVGGDVEFSVPVRRPPASAETSIAVELIQEDIDIRFPVVRNGELKTPSTRIVDRKVAEFTEQDSATLQLVAKNLAEGAHNFRIRIDTNDPLSADNERFVTINAKPEQPTLIISDDVQLAIILSSIANPFSATNEAESKVDRIRYVQFSETDLSRYSVVWLHDLPPMSSPNVDKLAAFAESGGNILQTLGPGLGSLANVTGNPVTKLFPGTLTDTSLNHQAAFLDIVALSHPMFQSLGELVNEKPWNRYPVYSNWSFDGISDKAQVLMKLSDDSSPGILLESRGAGQIMTLTTPIPQPETQGEKLWNELWVQDDIWAFVLLRGAIQSLYGATGEQTTFSVGSPVSLRNPRESWPSRYALFEPKTTSAKNIEATDGVLVAGTFDHAGTFRLRSLVGQPVIRSFSLNTPAADTQLTRLQDSTITEQLGENNFSIARDREDIQSSVGQARFGRELYPLLMLFVAGLFLAEQAMSNRFYKIKFR